MLLIAVPLTEAIRAGLVVARQLFVFLRQRTFEPRRTRFSAASVMESASNRTSLVTEQLPDDRQRHDQHGKDGATTDPVHSSPPRPRVQSRSQGPSLGTPQAGAGSMNQAQAPSSRQRPGGTAG